MRAIRLDMLERLDLIRPLLGKAEDTAKTGKPDECRRCRLWGGAQDLVEILSALGYRYTKPEKNEVTCELHPPSRKRHAEAPAPAEAQNKGGEASNGGAETANGQTDIDDPLTWAGSLHHDQTWKPMRKTELRVPAAARGKNGNGENQRTFQKARQAAARYKSQFTFAFCAVT